MKLLLDEMYSSALAEAFTRAGIDAATVASLGLAGGSDLDTFCAAISRGRAVLTENVSDFARIAADHSVSGKHHLGVLIALSTLFSRRPSGRHLLVGSVLAVRDEAVEDLVVYLRPSDQP